jgi:hypothetical protein
MRAPKVRARATKAVCRPSRDDLFTANNQRFPRPITVRPRRPLRARRSNRRDYRGQPETARDNRSQLPHPTTNHDHGLTGPRQDRRTRAKITVRAFVSSKCRDHPNRRELRIDFPASPTRRPVTSRFGHSSHERPAQPGFLKARSIQAEDSRDLRARAGHEDRPECRRKPYARTCKNTCRVATNASMPGNEKAS